MSNPSNWNHEFDGSNPVHQAIWHSLLSGNPNPSRWDKDFMGWDSGVITIDNFTCDLSTIDGLAFITNPLLDITGLNGRKIIMTSGGKTLTGWIKESGIGETLDTELITGWFNAGEPLIFETLTYSGKDITSAINSSGEAVAYSDAFTTLIPGPLYKAVSNFTINSGQLYLSYTADFLGSAVNGLGYVAGVNTNYFTSIGLAMYWGLYCSQPANFSATLTLRKVLTPSDTGVTIVSTNGGSTYNWASNDGINPNATSFTVNII